MVADVAAIFEVAFLYASIEGFVNLPQTARRLEPRAGGG